MSRKMLMTLAAVMALGFIPQARAAPQLTFGPSSGTAYTATQVGTLGHVSLTSSGFTTPVFDTALNLGTATWGSASVSGNLIPSTSNFTLAGAESLSVHIGALTATGSVAWTLDEDPLSVNLLIGTWNVTSSTLAGFTAGSHNFVDLTALTSGPDMVTLSNTAGAHENLSISSGEAISNIPEPASLVVLGAGFLGLGLTKRRLFSR